MRHMLMIATAALAMATSGCGILDSDGVELRLENGSNEVFDEVTIFTEDGPRAFTNLGPGERTEYFAVSLSYRIATTEVVVGTDEYRLQVIDFVGEEPLSSGRYTFVLGLTGNGPPFGLTQTLRED